MSSLFNSPVASPVDADSRQSSSAERERVDSRVSTRSDDSTTGSLRISSNQKTLKFFRNIVGQKNNDYHSDAPTMQHPSETNIHSRGISSRSGMSRGTFASFRLGGEGHSAGSASCWSRCCGCFSCLAWPADSRRYFLGRIIQSRSWKFILIVFTLLLLFGPQIRDMFIDKAGDTAMDIIFMTALVFFTLDILIRIDVEPNYFSFDLFCRRQRPQASSDLASGWMGCGSYGLGSFLFWCDVVSTLTLLHEISFINRDRFDEIQINITLDSFGVPVRSCHGSCSSLLLLLLLRTAFLIDCPLDVFLLLQVAGLGAINESTAVQTGETALLVTIGKTARVARFIRSSAAVKISSKINWYLLFRLFNPFCWLQTTRRKMGRGGSRRGSSTEMTADPTATSTSDGSNVRKKDLMRDASWGGIGLGALAAVKAQAKDHVKDDSGFKHAIKAIPARAWRLFGIVRHDDSDWRREMAASRIQRAWRAALFVRLDEDGIEGSDTRSHADGAWKSNSQSSSKASIALEKKHRLRAAVKMNAKNIKHQVSSGLSPSPTAASSGGTGGPPPTQTRNESQVGSAMRELTGQRVAIGIIIALVLTVLFTYTENNATRPSTMIVLHNQTANVSYANKSLDAARSSSVPDMFEYTLADNSTRLFTLTNGESQKDLRARETLRISVTGSNNMMTTGVFSQKSERREEALVSLLSTIFILLVWFFGVTAFAGPVMILVVIPIERMVRLLGMLMLDPLGYQSTSRYKRFVAEEDEISKNTRWSKEVLKGMETSFLMSTILRIGSLMKVGFGSAGVEIIRNNLLKGQSKNMLILNSQGFTVSCIFLFCDIRQFTDATECLQEEVFVFTNRIAAVVHSIVHSYGGSANKNVGDAFLLSWLLDDDSPSGSGGGSEASSTLTAKNNQADKALLSVVRICMALQHDDYYIEAMSDGARDALLTKLKGRKGPVVQMGCGLHAGKAVQGAIGSQRKIDATYVSEAVERAEFLESSTKKYGLKMLMSDSFHRLLHPSNRRRCRKVDQILIKNDDDDESDEDPMHGDIMELLTFDMDIEALWKNVNSKSETGHESDSESANDKGSKRSVPGLTSSARQTSAGILKAARRRSTKGGSDELSDTGLHGGASGTNQADPMEPDNSKPELVLPTGPALYNANVWVSEDMRRIRQLYSDGLFFQKFYSGLQSFYAKDWEHARQCFVSNLERFEDGPSRYFLTQIEENKGKPPKDFQGYGTG
jgi:class 3 adenylate cyclase